MQSYQTEVVRMSYRRQLAEALEQQQCYVSEFDCTWCDEQIDVTPLHQSSLKNIGHLY